MTASIAPKLFISYSWSNQDHEAWVINLAEELVSQGAHVILDKWDLQPGHDANAFMESMVTDPSVTKVVLICDQKYVEKSNNRSGGAGTEAQIISPELYAKKAQDKFVAVVRERDESDKPYIPVYYGSRIYIDLSSPASYSVEFDRLVRWVWDEPLYIRPALGVKPGFLIADQARKIATSVTLRRALDAVKSNAPNVAALAGEYFSTLSNGLESFRIEKLSDPEEVFDDLVIKSIADFTPLRNEALELFSAIAQYECNENMLRVVHRFFENIIPYMERPEHINHWNDTDFDNLKFIVYELFLSLIGILIKFEKFEAAKYILDTEYYWESTASRDEKMYSFLVFCAHIKSFDIRNSRLKLNRLSLSADIIKGRFNGTGIDFSYIMAADFVLYLRARNIDQWRRWWPHTLIYAGRFAGAFEMFARAKSSRYFDQIKSLIGVADKQAFGAMIDEIDRTQQAPRWQFESVNIRSLSGFEKLATTP